MKILFVSFNSSAGFYAYAIDFVNSVSRRAEKTFVLLTMEAESENFAPNVYIIKLPYRGGGLLKKLLFLNPLFNLRFYKILFKEKPEAVHFLFNHSGNLFIIALIKLFRLKSRLVFTLHNYDPLPKAGAKKSWNAWVDRKMLYYCDKIVFISDFLARRFLRDYPSLAGRSRVFSLGAPLWWEKYKVKNKEENIVLLLGRQNKERGTDLLCAAEPFISDKVNDYKIALVGQGAADYKATAGNPDKFLFVSRYVDNRTWADFLNRAKIVVLPYLEREGGAGPVHSGVLVTALVFGKAIILTRVGSFSEIIENGKDGLLVPPENPEALAEAIVDLLQNEEKRKFLAGGAYEAALGRFSIDAQMDDYFAFLANRQK